MYKDIRQKVTIVWAYFLLSVEADELDSLVVSEVVGFATFAEIVARLLEPRINPKTAMITPTTTTPAPA